MNDKSKEQGNADYSNITPTSISLTRHQESNPGHKAEAVKPLRSRLWLIPFLALLVIAAGVVFILPDHIETRTVGTEQTASTTPASSAAGTPGQSGKTAASEVSPFQQAQEARQRSRSQQMLSEILKLQEELEQKNVLIWGADKYNTALGLAEQGDAAYRTRDFLGSADFYNDAARGLQDLLDEMNTIFNQAITKGSDAIIEGDATLARENFEFALQIKPDDEAALTGLARSNTLDEVLALMTEGNNLQQNAELEAARDQYQQALALDKNTAQARQQIKTVNQKITNRDFNNLMSEGYRYLQQNDLQKARLTFQRASRLKPNAAEVTAALNQTQTGITNQEINKIMSDAVQLENEEKWKEAVAEYNKALAIDANLAQAQEGIQYSQSRANLDSRFEQIIGEPGRLSNKAVYEESRLLYQTASSIANPQPRLSQQLEKVRVLLDNALEPVQVSIRSDNLTEVTLFKVASLGKFEEKSLSLLPGNYVMVGTREGYRDVRVEFTLQAGQASGQAINISAIEKIASR